ncbi:efflux RND transporter permease subunit [Rheinheimera sp. MMS21-TC3]|uniref:efflux RND transporter permease subunit n=1 Tax=Rheinheimera sp. MMS21-TC3 TaxID=3072790 RepID=UPI0028C3C818|nr:efflux RND transporter permease subunit [Rheinheimera sp. MMS21-TC3]WNO60629.1 efflux RND transporter permease subunit [Rheinheimera sp. MMS21-TC3]
MNNTFMYKLLNSKFNIWLLSLTLLFTVVSIVGLKDIGLASDYKIFFDQDDKDLKILETMESRYSTTDNVFIMIKAKENSIYNTNTIKLIYDLSQALWQVQHVSRVDSLTNFPYSRADGDDIVIEEFVYEAEQITPDYVQQVKLAAEKERDLVGSLISADGQYSAINITTLLPGDDHKLETLAVSAGIDQLVEKFRLTHPEHEFYVTGLVAMNSAFFVAAKSDFTTLIPLMIVFVLIAAGIILGSIQAAFCILTVLLLSMLGALGLAGWFGINLSAPSISAPIIMFTVIVASSIHIISYVKRQLMKGDSQLQAVLSSYKHNTKPVIVSHLTTIIGFLAMNASDSPPFRDLGNIVAFGVMFSLLLSFTVTPTLLLKVKLSNKESYSVKVFQNMHWLSSFVISRKKQILYIVVPLTLIFSGLSFLNKGNDDLIKYFNESVPFRFESEVIDEQFSALYNIGYSLDSGQASGVFLVEFLEFTEKFDNWLMQQPEVMITNSPLHRIKQLNRLMNNDDPNFYIIPSSPTMAAQHFLLYEMSLPFGKDVGDMLSFDKSALKLTARLRNSSSVEMIKFEQKVVSWIDNNKPNFINYTYSSPSLIFAHIGQTNILSLLKGAFLAFIVISIALSFVFRSFYIGVLTLIPNLLPVGMAFGFWYFIQGEISMGLAGVSAMAIGIIVDDTVHFLYQYINGLKKGLTPEESVKYTFDRTMGAIVISSILLVIGFLLLSSSSFEKNAQMGLLTSGTIVLALLFDLVVLPVLAMRFIRNVPSHSTENKLRSETI